MSLRSELAQPAPRNTKVQAPRRGRMEPDALPSGIDAAPVAATRRSWGWLLVAILSLFVLGGGFYLQARFAAVPEPPPAAGASQKRTVAAPGLVESCGGLRDLAFQTSGQIKTVLVEEGQTVKQGQFLAELDNDILAARLAAVRADLGTAEAQAKVLAVNLDADEKRAQFEVDRLQAELDRLRKGARPEELERVRAETKAAELEWQRRAVDAERYTGWPAISSPQDRDMTRGLAGITQAQFHAAQARQRELEAGTRQEDLAKAVAQLEAAKAECARLRETRGPRLAAAGQQVEQAQALVRQAEAELRRTRLEAPLDGVVVWRFRHPGETVGVLPPERVLSVADPAALRVRADVDEADFARLRVGQPVRVTADAFGPRSFAGKVASISHAAGEKRFLTGEAREMRDVKIVETLVSFDEPPPLKLGLRVSVFFQVEAVAPAR